MVFGLAEGSIDIKMLKTSFVFGETIDGTVFLRLQKEKKARGLAITLLAEKIVHRGKHSHTETIFSNQLVLAQENTFFPPGKDYSFKIQLPATNPDPEPPKMNGIFGAIIELGKVLGSYQKAKWYLEAKLDVPMAFDTSKRVQISVQ